LIVFVVVYGVLQWFKPLGEDKGINSIIALCIAALLLFSRDAVGIVNFIAPWFAILFIFFFLGITLFRLVGAPSSAIEATMSKWGTLHWWLLALALLIMMGALSEVYGPRISPYGEENLTETTEVIEEGEPEGYKSRVTSILFHPRVLGLVLILLIVVFAIRVLTEPVKG
jgi:hypothetical protein